MKWLITVYCSYTGTYYTFVCNKYPALALLRFLEEPWIKRDGIKLSTLHLINAIETNEEFVEEYAETGGMIYDWD